MQPKSIVGCACVVVGCTLISWSVAAYESRVEALREARAKALEILNSDELVLRAREDPTDLDQAFGRIGGLYQGANDRLFPIGIGVLAIATGALLPFVGPKAPSKPRQ